MNLFKITPSCKTLRTYGVVTLLALSSFSGYAASKPQFQLELVNSVQTNSIQTYYVPGTPSHSTTDCNGTATGSGTTTNLNTDCTTTTTAGRAAYSGTRYSYSEDIRVIMPDNSHLTLWCQEGFRTCLHLASGKYRAERDKDKIWIYCTYANQKDWDETGMSPGQREASHQVNRVKYRVVGSWKDDSAPSSVSANESVGIDPGLMAFVDLNNDVNAGSSSLHSSARQMGDIKPDETICTTEVVFGEVYVCKVNAPNTIVALVATRSLPQMHRHWLEAMSRDFLELKRLSLLNCRGADNCKEQADFIKGLEQGYHSDGSVWTKLWTRYCIEVPSGTYPDLNGEMRNCSVQKKDQSLSINSANATDRIPSTDTVTRFPNLEN